MKINKRFIFIGLACTTILLSQMPLLSAPQKSEDVKKWEEEYLRLKNDMFKLKQQIEKILESIPSDFGTEKIQTLKKEYMRLKIECEEMNKIYKPTYPKLEQLLEQMLLAREKLINEIAEVISESKIELGDSLKITVYGLQEFDDFIVRVDKDGIITIPLLGRINVEGLTINEIDKKLTELLGKDFLQNPHVTVSLVSK